MITQEHIDAMRWVVSEWPYADIRFRRGLLIEIHNYLDAQLHPPAIVMDRHEPVWYQREAYEPITDFQSDQ